ncbi:MAG: hypothetical protein GY874_03540 [Desulfobacteraceae bacterium]|nr:hypothetical protein [Desulfobacteraceae bacterium]
MEIICQSCQGKLKLQDDKIPAGKSVTVKCPNCKNKLSISRPEEEEEEKEQSSFDDLFDVEDDNSEGYDTEEQPFDFIEEEGRSALICESEPIIRSKIKPTLDILEYHITEAANNREALKKMRYHNYDLIIVNEKFGSKDIDANPVFIYLERMEMAIRRDIFVVLVTSRYRTMDSLRAFQKSVNMIVNIRNIDDFDKILQRAMADFGLFYKVYKESAIS